jgi:hypothetical protein
MDQSERCHGGPSSRATANILESYFENRVSRNPDSHCAMRYFIELNGFEKAPFTADPGIYSWG